MTQYTVPQPVLSILRQLRAGGHEAWLAGGCVRDLLLGRAPRDWDVATSADGPSVASLFPRINPVGLRHNTVGVFEDGFWVEVTTFRDPGRSLEGDLGLRDFTVNAIAFNPLDDRLVDPLDGRSDLTSQCLRACGEASARFDEDPLRILRAARFIAELGFRPHEAVTDAGRVGCHSVRHCAPERIRDELLKLILGPEVRASFAWMQQTGLLEVILPHVAVTQGVTQNRFHRWDVYWHTVETVARAVADPEVRLAGLYHDLGKPATREWRKGDYTFYNHERISAEIADADLDHYRLSSQRRQRIVSLVNNHMFHYEPSWSDAAVRRFLRRVGPDLMEPLFELRRADSSASGMGGEEETNHNLCLLNDRIQRQQAAHAAVKVTDLDISGHDVIALTGQRGPAVGRILREMLERVTDDPALNRKDLLLREIERWTRDQH